MPQSANNISLPQPRSAFYRELDRLLVLLLVLGALGAAWHFRYKAFHAAHRMHAFTAQQVPAPRMTAAPAGGITHVVIGDQILQPDVRRMGINLGDQAFYGSGQLLKNLVMRNPGFEGETWQSILHCVKADATHCTDATLSAQWPDKFLQDAEFEVISGAAEGRTGHVLSSLRADNAHNGVDLTLDISLPLRPGDYLIVRKQIPGNADAGWWLESTGGRLETEFRDLSPHSPGHQALRMLAAGAGQSIAVASYFDSTEDRSFLRIRGHYRLTFRAKLLAGNPALHLSLARLAKPREISLYTHDAALTPAWRDYTFDFNANEPDGTVGAVRLRFGANGTSLLLDDVSLERTDTDPANTTAFRDEVVSALTAFHPGVLRFMASSTALGASVSDLEAGDFARRRSEYSVWKTEQLSLSYGLTDFLALCARVNADPWIVLPAGATSQEAAQLVTWLSDRGYTSRFHQIHIELGNEVWNGIFYGETIDDAVVYAHRANTLFSAMRRARGFNPPRFDLIMGGFVRSPDRNTAEAQHAGAADSLAVAPYMMYNVHDESSSAALFGPLLAEPQMFTNRGGMVAANRAIADAGQPRALHLAIYETNLHTVEGSISQAGLDRFTPSLGAGLAVAEEMLLMLREEGATTQAVFALPGTDFRRNDGKLVQLWGTVYDMGVTNRKRPQFLALQMANAAMRGTLLATHITGFDPTWSETNANDGVSIQAAHEIESFAFADASGHSLILMNLSLTSARTVQIDGVSVPQGTVKVSTLNADAIDATNESTNRVTIQDSQMQMHSPAQITLPPHSMTTIRW